MRSFIIVFLLFISTILLLPLSLSQVDDRECPASAACELPFEVSELTNTMPDFAQLGFDEESISIPASGSTIVIGSEEDLFILSEQQIIVTMGEPGEDLLFRGIVPGRRINQLELPRPDVGETLFIELTMLEVTADQLERAGFPADNPIFAGINARENVDSVENCISLQNSIEELRKDIQDRNKQIEDLRNQPGGFQNRTVQSMMARLQNDNDRDNQVLPTMEAQFEILQCTRVPRDEQQRPEARPTGVESSFQKAFLIIVGEDSPSDFIPNYMLENNNLHIEKNTNLELALLEPTDGYRLLSGSFGTIEYPSVVSPGSEFIIRYNNTIQDFDPSGESIDFVLETTRKLRIYSQTEDLNLSIEKNGTIASTTLTLPDTQTGYFEITIPEIGESENGDSPLQYGLHFFHVHSNFAGIGTLDTYLPVYVAPSSDYNLVAYSLSSEEDLRLNLAEYVPESPELFITGKSNGVTTFIHSQIIDIPIAVLSISDNIGPITNYQIEIEGDFTTSYFDGKTYVLGNSNSDTFSISSLKVFNFEVSNFNILDNSERDKTYSNKLGFPHDLLIIIDVNTIDISVLDEFEQPYIDGQIIVEKGNEEYTADLLEIPRLKLPNGDYKITHVVNDEIKSERDMTISSSGLIQFTIQTLLLEDQILTIAIIIESVLIAFFSIRILSKYFRG
ncbi:MAG: hypothetical protein CMO19_00760 [Thaumarchaeota archaeon]|nr:hypothetical protein [Nitrososphaerota archaeon]|tara:strand:- start:813 stop:2843 length:2031 start_codon:yes stop_codon:yes gene_type:complete